MFNKLVICPEVVGEKRVRRRRLGRREQSIQWCRCDIVKEKKKEGRRRGEGGGKRRRKRKEGGQGGKDGGSLYGHIQRRGRERMK